jgi:hypothetical protein
MDYKVLNNDISIYYYPELDNNLLFYIDNPYYMILFLLIEMQFSELELKYSFKKYFSIQMDHEEIENILNILENIFNTMLDYYTVDYQLFTEIKKCIENYECDELFKLMFPNYKYVIDYNELSFTEVKNNFKYNLKNSDIHFITSDKLFYQNCDPIFKIKKFVKRPNPVKIYNLPIKIFDYKFNLQNIIGIYLDEINYFENYILDILNLILTRKGYDIDNSWISKKYKVLVIYNIPLSKFKKLVNDIKKGSFTINLEYEKIIENKDIIDIINHKKFDINIYDQVSKNDIINFSKKIFTPNNIKFLGKKHENKLLLIDL